jgi:hypothetical protein
VKVPLIQGRRLAGVRPAFRALIEADAGFLDELKALGPVAELTVRIISPGGSVCRHHRRLAETRIHAETATIELRASEVANPRR